MVRLDEVGGAMESFDEQTRAEMEAHVRGPGWVAMAWYLAVCRDDEWDLAWMLSDPELRLARAQAWLWNNRHHPAVAEIGIEELADRFTGPNFQTASLWREFAQIETAAYRRAWDDFDPAEIGLASRPRLIDVDYELCLLAKAEGVVYTQPTQIRALRFLMHLVDGEWKVANAGGTEHAERRVVPGWPPQL